VKPGDLVKMKDVMWWRLQDRKDFTQETGLVLSIDYNAIKVILSSGKKKCGLADHWEVVSESR
jgi:hypothetical protein